MFRIIYKTYDIYLKNLIELNAAGFLKNNLKLNYLKNDFFDYEINANHVDFFHSLFNQVLSLKMFESTTNKKVRMKRVTG